MIIKRLSQALVLLALTLNFSCVNEDITEVVPDQEKNTQGPLPDIHPEAIGYFSLVHKVREINNQSRSAISDHR